MGLDRDALRVLVPARLAVGEYLALAALDVAFDQVGAVPPAQSQDLVDRPALCPAIARSWREMHTPIAELMALDRECRRLAPCRAVERDCESLSSRQARAVRPTRRAASSLLPIWVTSLSTWLTARTLIT